jgi:hypothetical protein
MTKKQRTFEQAISDLNSAINGHRRGAKIPERIRECFSLSADNASFVEAFGALIEKQFRGTKGTDPTRAALRMALKRERDGNGYQRDGDPQRWNISVEFDKKGSPSVGVTMHKTAEPEPEQDENTIEPAASNPATAGAERASVTELEKGIKSMSAPELLQVSRDLIHAIESMDDSTEALKLIHAIRNSLTAAAKTVRERASMVEAKAA